MCTKNSKNKYFVVGVNYGICGMNVYVWLCVKIWIYGECVYACDVCRDMYMRYKCISLWYV